MRSWFQVLENNGAGELGPNECTLAIRELLTEVNRCMNFEVLRCRQCGDQLYPSETVDRIIKQEKKNA